MSRTRSRAKPSLERRLVRVEAAVQKLASALTVRREEHDQVLAALNQLARNDEQLARHAHDLDIQFKRIAQMQAELDALQRAWERIKVKVV